MPPFPRLLQACHPQPTAAVTVIAAALATRAGSSPSAVGAAVLAGQLSIGWSNDWLDADRDRAVRRTDKPVVRGLPVTTVRTAALLALAACVPLSLHLGPYAGAAHLVAVASAWAYNLRVKATAWSWAPYALSFGLLPSVITAAGPAHPFAPWWAAAAGALLGVGAHSANVLPDLDDDRTTGVRGLPQRLGRTGASALSGGALLLATAVLLMGPRSPVSGMPGGVPTVLALAVLVFGAGLLAGRRPTSRAPFLAVIVVAALDVGLLLARGTALV